MDNVYTSVVDKYPNEIFNEEFDFVNEIPSGDSIRGIGGESATNVTVINSSGADATSSIVIFKSVSGTKLIAKLSSFTATQTEYVVTAIAEMTSSGERFKKTLLLRVGQEAVLV